MVKKILRLLAILSPAIFALPMFLGMWQKQVTSGDTVKTDDAFGIFANLQDFKDVYGETFNSGWLTTFTVFAVVALVVSVAVTVLYLLNDLKVTKLNKFETIAGVVLLLVSVLAVVFGILSVTTNAELLVTYVSTTKLIPAAGMWVFYFGAPIMGILAVLGANPNVKAGGKKRKRK